MASSLYMVVCICHSKPQRFSISCSTLSASALLFSENSGKAFSIFIVTGDGCRVTTFALFRLFCLLGTWRTDEFGRRKLYFRKPPFFVVERGRCPFQHREDVDAPPPDFQIAVALPFSPRRQRAIGFCQGGLFAPAAYHHQRVYDIVAGNEHPAIAVSGFK